MTLPILDSVLTGLSYGDAFLISVASNHGSGPREAGAWMAVFSTQVLGTIGGGRLEYEAIADARQRLAGADGDTVRRFNLGPSLGQCCGGVVRLRFEPVSAADIPSLRQRFAPALSPVALFGAGHVGKAVVNALAPLPFAVTWIDSREGIFPTEVPATVVCEQSGPVQAAVPQLAAGSHVLVMSFSHAEDMDVVAACLRRSRERGDLPYIGLIGSKSKWAAFRHRLQERGFTHGELARVTSPIGLPGIAGKQPGVIAASVAAQLLMVCPAG